MSKQKPKATAKQKTLPTNKLFMTVVVWFSFTWSWMLSTDSLTLAGSHTQGLIIAGIASVINVLIAAGIILGIMRLMDKIFNKRNVFAALAMSLFLMAAADFLVAWLTALFWYGEGGSLDNVLPLGSPALLLIHSPFGFASRLIGFYGLAGFGWLALYLVFHRQLRKLVLAPIITLGVLSAIGWAAYSTPDGRDLNATVINESLGHRLDPVDARSTDLIVFPEYGLDNVNEENINTRISHADQAKTHFIGSQQFYPKHQSGHHNVQLAGNTQDGFTSKHTKDRLIPAGEYLPANLRLSLKALGKQDTITYFSFAKKVIKGSDKLKPITLEDGVTIGPGICSGIIAPHDYRRLSDEGANLLTNSASLEVFQGSIVFGFQHNSLSKFNAIANSRYYLQSSNKGSGYALDNNGQTIASVSGRDSSTVRVQTNNTTTIYTMTGEWMVIIGTALLALLLLNSALTNKRLVQQTLSKSRHNQQAGKKPPLKK